MPTIYKYTMPIVVTQERYNGLILRPGYFATPTADPGDGTQKTVNTSPADVTAAVNTAKAQAIAAAATDATTKADNAQSAAISTAATDATGKANAAQTAATTYADTVVASSVSAVVTTPSPRRIVTNNLWVASAITNRTDSGTGRTRHRVMTSASDLRFTWGAHYTSNPNTGSGLYGTDADFPADITIRAGVEIGGTIYRLLFNGQDTITIKPGARVTSDALGVEVLAGSDIFVRTFITSTSWYANTANFATDSTDGGWTLTTDLTAPGSAAVSTGTHWQFAPMLITGVPAVTKAIAVAILGDSLSVGTGENITGAAASSEWANASAFVGGFANRALSAASMPHINIGHGGERLYLFKDYVNRFRRTTYIDACTHAICEGGVNDANSSGQTLANIQANMITVWKLCNDRGLRAFQTTITPNTTSTDAWATTTNQTIPNSGNETKRVSLNTWLRDGAPILAGVAVATGSNAGGTVRAGATGHPLKGVFEIADLAESARNSGLWKANYTADGLHPVSTAHAALAAGIVTSSITL